MVDIQSAMAEIRRGKKKKKKDRTNDRMKILWLALFHRAAKKVFKMTRVAVWVFYNQRNGQ